MIPNSKSTWFLTETVIQKGYLLKCLKTWGPDFIVTFDIRIKRLVAAPGENVMLLTTEKDRWRGAGSRIPSVWIREAEITVKIVLNEPVANDYAGQSESYKATVGEWYHVELSQKQINGDSAKFTFKVNETVAGEIDTIPMQFKDVSWYQSWTVNSVEDQVDIKNVHF